MERGSEPEQGLLAGQGWGEGQAEEKHSWTRKQTGQETEPDLGTVRNTDPPRQWGPGGKKSL